MKNTKKNHLIQNIIRVLWLVFGLFGFFYWLFQADRLLCRDYSSACRYIALDDHWEITINDEAYHDVSLADFYFKAVDKGDRIVMERVLPDDWGIEVGALRLHIKQSAVEIYINDECIYEYGYDRIADHKMVGSGFQFICFPKEYEGKKIRIEWNVSEDEVFTKFDSMRIYEWANAYKALLTENRLPMFFGSFLIIFGLAMMLITIFALLFSIKYIRMYCIAIFSICMGLWTICYYNVILVYAISLYSVSLLEYMALYVAPLTLIIYMYENVKKLKQRVLKVLYWILFSVQLVFEVVIISLHAIDVVHLAAGLKYMQILMVCHLVYFLAVLLLNLKSSRRADRLYLIGILIVSGSVGYDLLSYYVNRFRNVSFLALKGVSCIGVMIFVFIMILVFYMNLTEKLMKETEQNSLIRSAYTDELTQLHNRRYCSEHMQKISDENCSDYVVVCFDLNNLKVTNDTYGHAKGDILIKSAADVIAETFGKSGIVGRMGGDEFIAVLMTSSREEIETLMDEFARNISKRNKKEQDLNLSISYGYALSSESEERNIEKIYQMADDRMYLNKKQYKNQQKDHSING